MAKELYQFYFEADPKNGEDHDVQLALYLIKEAVKRAKLAIFVPSYLEEAKDSEVLGILVSKWAQWVGETILEVTYEALEDASYHDEAAEVQEIFNKMQADGEFIDD